MIITVQFCTNICIRIFKELIKEQFPAPLSPDAESGSQCFSYEEKNALNYAAGYIPKALRKQLEHSSHQLKEELISCLNELTEDDGIDDVSQGLIKQIDRGGLTLQCIHCGYG